MKINENTVNGKWLEIRGDIQKAWGKLTADELDQAEGDMKKIAGLIQQKYGAVQKESDQKLSNIFDKYQKH